MKKLRIALLTTLSLFLFLSCEIGLGASVDTEAPSLEITNPPADAVIRDAFAISGTWTDDGAISSVSVDLVNLNNNNKINVAGSFNVKDERGGSGTWTVPINPIDNNLLDGTYEAVVAIYDNGGHRTTMARSFTIDNTPPVMILQKPSTTISDAADRFDTFGQVFSIVGQAADDSSIEKIDVSVYSSPDCTDSSFIKKITLGSVPPTIDLNVAVFEDGVENDYSTIYGHLDKNSGKEKRYFKLEIYDNAKKYLSDGSVDESGNKQTSFYLYKDISDLINDYKATGLYKIQSGTYTGTEGKNVSLTTAKTRLSQDNKLIGKFQLNPNNNPTYVVSSRTPLVKGASLDDMSYQLTTGNNYIEIQVDPGLDSNPIDEDSVGLYLVECDNNGKPKNNNKIWLFQPKTETNPNAHSDAIVVTTVSGDSYKFKTAEVISNLTFEGLQIEKYYRIYVVGQDTTGAEIVSDSNSIYGFKLVSSGNFIELVITSEPTFITSNESSNGDASTEQNVFTVKLRYQGGSSPYAIFEDDEVYASNVADYETTIVKDKDAIRALKDAGKSTLEYQIKGSDGISASTVKTVSFIIDDDRPVIKDDTIKVGTSAYNPTTYYDNQYLNISGGFTEANMDTVYYYVQYPGRTDSVPENLITTHDGEISKFVNGTFEFKSVEFRDNNGDAANTLYLQAIDKSGNISERKAYTINIDTSAPELKACWSKIGDGAFNNASETIYVKKDASLCIYGTYSDPQSGVNPIVLPDNFPAGAVLKYSNTEIASPNAEASNFSTVTDIPESDWVDYSSANKNLIKSWRLIYTPTASGAVPLTGTSYAGKTVTVNAFTIVLDEKKPEITVNKFYSVSGSGENQVTADVYHDEQLNYYLNPTGKTFTLKGNVTDNYGLDNITLFKNEVLTENKIGDSILCDSAVKEFTFANINMADWGEAPKVIIAVTDKAGNLFEKEITIIVDTKAPEAEHKIDDLQKDLVFRLGDYANDRNDKDVGGKYSNGTYGSASTLQIRGNFADSGDGANGEGASGINKYYYKVFNNTEVTLEPNAEDASVTEGKIFFKSLETLKDYVIKNKTDIFSPLDSAEPKSVEYNIKAGEDDPPKFGGEPTGKTKEVEGVTYTQYRTDITSNYKTTIKGFDEGKNYLVIVAEDNAGNSNVDYAEVSGIKYVCYSLNIDITAPTIPTKLEGTQYTNGEVDLIISGTVSDKPNKPNGSSGIKAVTLTRDGGTGSVSVSSFTAPSAAERDSAGENYTNDETLQHWEANVKNILPSSGNAIISATVTDNAGHSTTMPVATVIVDKNAPEVIITSPVEDVKTGCEFTISGTASDGSGAGLDKNKKMIVWYTKDTAITESTEWIDLAEINTAETWSYEADVKDLTDSEGAKIFPEENNTPLYIRVSATDKSGSGNTGYSEPRLISIDRKKPEYVPAESSVGGKADTLVGSSWFKDSTLNIIGKFTDEGGSGVKTINYKVDDGPEQSLPTTDGTYNTNVSGFTSGSNTLYIWAVDAAGNSSEVKNYTVRVDSNPPEVSQYDDAEDENDRYPFTNIYLTNGTQPVSFKFYVTEAVNESLITEVIGEDPEKLTASAIALKIGSKSVPLKIIASNAAPAEGESSVTIDANSNENKRIITVTIASDVLSDATLTGYQTMLITVTDKAGNTSTPTAVGIINKDSNAPTLSFTSPDTGTEVNKTITVSGKAADANEVTEITLVAECGSNSKTYTKTSADSATKIDYANGIWSATIDTTELDNTFSGTGKDLTLTLTAKDAAGNETKPADAVKRTLKINQNSDRPIITIGSSVNFTEKNGDEIWVKGSATIYGSVVDDDGIASDGFKVYKKYLGPETAYIDSDFVDANASYSGGSWNVKLQNDGSYILKFEVKDKADTTFISADIDSSSEDSAILSTPIIQDSPEVANAVPNQFGNTKANGKTLIPICLDTTPPLLIITGISIDNSTWYEDTNTQEINLGGNYTTLYIKAEASDSSGLFGDTDTSGLTIDTVPSATCNIEKTENPKEYIFTISNLGNVPTGTLNINIKAKDKAGLETTKNFSRSVDNSAPVITFKSPEMDTINSGEVTVYGTTNEIGKKIWYTVSTDGTNKPSAGVKLNSWSGYSVNSAGERTAKTGTIADKDVPAYTEIPDAGISWYVYFDGNTSDTNRAHAIQLKNYVISLGITNNLNNFTDLVNFYIWIKIEDAVGNMEEYPYLVCVDPNGDRPIVTLSNPENDADSMGGTIKLYGSAEDNTLVESVWVQLLSDTHTGDGSGYGSVSVVNNKIDSFTPTVEDLNYWANLEDAQGHKVYTVQKIKPEEDGTHKDWTGTLAQASGDTPAEIAADYGIKASFSGSSWNLKINKENEFNPLAGASSANNMAVRIYACDNDKNLSYATTRYFKIDNDTPVISDRYLKQYTDDDPTKAEKKSMSLENTSVVYVRGKWFLTFKVTDNEKIESLVIVDKAGNETAIADSYIIKTSVNEWNVKYPLNTNATGTGTIEFTVKATDDETNGHTGSYEFMVNYDNEAPKLLVETSNDFNISSEIKQSSGFYRLASKVSDASLTGTPSGVKAVGFYFMRRKSSSEGLVYDPMQIRQAPISTTNLTYSDGLYWLSGSITIDEAMVTLGTGLSDKTAYIHAGSYMQISGVMYRIESVTGTIVNLESAPDTTQTTGRVALALFVDNRKSEYENGTAKNTNGYYSSIKNDDGDGVVEELGGTTAVSSWTTSIVSRNIPDGPIEIHYTAYDESLNYAMGIVGNEDWNTYKAYTSPEAVAVKDLEKGLDGEYAKFLYTYDSDSRAYISNNAPRLASVTVAVDYTGTNNIADATRYTSYYKRENLPINGEYVTKTVAVTKEMIVANEIKTGNTVTGYKGFTALKGKTWIIPEMVGGNGKLWYKYEIYGSDSNGRKTGSVVKASTSATYFADGFDDFDTYIETAGGNSYVVAHEASPIIHDEEFLEGLASSSIDQPTWFNYTIYDSTEGEAAAVLEKNQKAKINVALAVMVKDETAPNVVIHPFYWKSQNDNSLYNNSTANGHIELESDWMLTEKYVNNGTSATTGEFDADPKVSGKVVIKGYAYDNKRLTKLQVVIQKSTVLTEATTVAVYENNVWKDSSTEGTVTGLTKGTLADDGWEFTVSTAPATGEATDAAYADEKGHKVKWTLIYDTSKVTGIAATDVEVKVIAIDSKNNTSEESTKRATIGTADETTHTPAYQMDVVPYISDVETALSKGLKNSIRSAYSRTALGHYIARWNENIEIKGFNLGTAPVYNSTSLTQDNGVLKLAASNITTSGKISLSVNGVETLNNLNNNNACGSYTTGITEDSTYTEKNTYAYNRKPNRTSNNLLTDDVYIDIWQFDSNAALPKSGELREPSMMINPVTGEVGLAFVDGPAHFAMAGTVSDTSYSYAEWQRNFATYNNISFAYDMLGHAHATATGLDTNPNTHHAGRFSYFYDKWYTEESLNTQEANYQGKNALRLESIAVPYIAPITSDEPSYAQYLKYGHAFAQAPYYQVLSNDTLILTEDGSLTETRFNSPSLVTTVHGTGDTAKTSVYLAYYDSVQKQIRFRYNSEVSATRGSKNDFVDEKGFKQGKTGTEDGTGSMYYEANTKYFSLIAGVDTQQGEEQYVGPYTNETTGTFSKTDADGNLVPKTDVDGNTLYKMSDYRNSNLNADGTLTDVKDKGYTIAEFTMDDTIRDSLNEALRSRFTVGEKYKWIQNGKYKWIIQDEGLIYYTTEDNPAKGYLTMVPCTTYQAHEKSVKVKNNPLRKLDPEEHYIVYEKVGLSDSSISEGNGNNQVGTVIDGYKYKFYQQPNYYWPYSNGETFTSETVDNIPIVTPQYVYKKYDTGLSAYKYVAIDAKAGSAAANDVVVAVWYDGRNCRYAYTDNPTNGFDNSALDDNLDSNGKGWKGNKIIFTEGGEHCTVKLDSEGRVHIAAYVDGSLRYAHLDSVGAGYNEATDSVKVDSFTITGERITLDVGKDSNGNVIPYISYFNGTARLPCVAKLVVPAGSTPNYKAQGTGTDDGEDMFTGNWEISLVPSPKTLTTNYYDKMNICLWKKNGTIVRGDDAGFTISKTKTTKDNSSGTTNGNIYGNGSANPILGYAIESTSGTCLETAQMK